MPKDTIFYFRKLFYEISKKWTAEIIHTFIAEEFRTLRFSELVEKIPGINPKTLSTRLKEMEKLGLIERKGYVEIPPRVEYSITQKGRELGVAFRCLVNWASKWEKG